MAELLARCSSEELTEWMAYEKVAGPLGGARHDVLNAILAATVSNTARGKKGKRAKIQDFLPKWDPRKQRMSWEQMLEAVKGINARLGGTVGGGKGDGHAGGPPGRDRDRNRRTHQRR